MTDYIPDLYWDATYAIAMALIEHYPELSPEDVGLQELAELVQNLPGFKDDPDLVNDQILLDIQTVWYEEATTL
ncbi:MAG: Fe-S assembly protein IscX [Chloroflexi bacterium]|nr:MAG: Fe-S assembly protein IscX [Chloroflexota bacterium]